MGAERLICGIAAPESTLRATIDLWGTLFMSKLLNRNKRQWVEALVWFLVTLFVVIAKTIYYANAHSLTSSWMDNAWIYPAALTLFNLILAFLGKDFGAYPRLLVNSGSAAIIVYLFLRGVYEMSSNYNESTPLFFYFGLVILIVGFLWGMLSLFLKLRKDEKPLAQ